MPSYQSVVVDYNARAALGQSVCIVGHWGLLDPPLCPGVTATIGFLCVPSVSLSLALPAATEVTTVFIFHEPSQLTPLQDNGLPGVVLNSVINKQVECTTFYNNYTVQGSNFVQLVVA